MSRFKPQMESLEERVNPYVVAVPILNPVQLDPGHVVSLVATFAPDPEVAGGYVVSLAAGSNLANDKLSIKVTHGAGDTWTIRVTSLVPPTPASPLVSTATTASTSFTGTGLANARKAAIKLHHPITVVHTPPKVTKALVSSHSAGLWLVPTRN